MKTFLMGLAVGAAIGSTTFFVIGKGTVVVLIILAVVVASSIR